MDDREETAEHSGEADNDLAQQGTRRRRRKERRYRFGSQKRRIGVQLPRLSWWREALLVVLLVTAVFFLINPFTRLAQARATAAKPLEPLAVTPPTLPEEGYCLAGDFQEWNGRSTPLLDDGTQGDSVAGDGVFSRTVTFAEPGRYLWRAMPCGQWELGVPEKSAWVFVTMPNQPITFTFTPDLPSTDLWPQTYALKASDTLFAGPVAVGSFQTRPWDSEDGTTQMRPSGNGQYQLDYRVPRPGSYEVYVAVQGYTEGFGADGRSREPIPLTFTTQSPMEMVVIQYDGRTDRIAVLYGIPGWLGSLAYGWGARIIAGISIVGMLVLGAQMAYSHFVLRPDRQYSAGCPNCQQHDLRRISRETSDYLLSIMGIPVRRYRCSQCGWKGRRVKR